MDDFIEENVLWGLLHESLASFIVSYGHEYFVCLPRYALPAPPAFIWCAFFYFTVIEEFIGRRPLIRVDIFQLTIGIALKLFFSHVLVIVTIISICLNHLSLF